MTALRLSNSEMSSWRRCRRRWYLGTYRRLTPRVAYSPGSPLSVGTLVHDALAAYYDPDLRADPVAHADAAVARAIEAAPAFELDYRKEHKLVRAMLEGYLEWLAETGADSDLRVLGSESMIEVPLADGVTLLSKLDALVERESDGARLALEHKTTASLTDPLPLLKLDTQFLTEHLARFLADVEAGASAEESLDRCQGVLWNGLRKVQRTASAKPPFYGREDVLHNVHELRYHWRHVLSTAQDIQLAIERLDTGNDHHVVCPPNPTRDCRWDCDFFRVCVMLDDGSDAEGALAALYVEGDPLARYEKEEAHGE